MKQEIMQKLGLDKLGLKEITAIELRYLGNTSKEIGEKIETPNATIDEWFSNRGKLFGVYAEYVAHMNSERTEKVLNRLIETDENILAMTTNMMRGVGTNLKSLEYLAKLTVADFERAWKIQMIMTKRPTNYEKQEIETKVTDTDKLIDRLGLTSEDFEDANIQRTKERIEKLLESSPDN